MHYQTKHNDAMVNRSQIYNDVAALQSCGYFIYAVQSGSVRIYDLCNMSVLSAVTTPDSCEIQIEQLAVIL